MNFYFFLVIWFHQMRRKHVPISLRMIAQKATLFFQEPELETVSEQSDNENFAGIGDENNDWFELEIENNKNGRIISKMMQLMNLPEALIKKQLEIQEPIEKINV